MSNFQEEGFSQNIVLIITVVAVILVAGTIGYLVGFGGAPGDETEPPTPIPTTRQVVTQPPAGDNGVTNTPTVAPSPTDELEPNVIPLQSGYVEPGSEEGQFTLTVPAGTCDASPLETGEEIRCIIESTDFFIYPEAAGHGADVISESTVTLGGITWDKTVFRTGEGERERGVSYLTELDGTTYYIEVQYPNYNETLEAEAEDIIATFERR